jgi:hypothetical protein
MTTDIPYNAHCELSPAGHIAVARSCGGGWWEEWVCVSDREWRRLAELLLDGRVSARDPGDELAPGVSQPLSDVLV